MTVGRFAFGLDKAFPACEKDSHFTLERPAGHTLGASQRNLARQVGVHPLPNLVVATGHEVPVHTEGGLNF